MTQFLILVALHIVYVLVSEHYHRKERRFLIKAIKSRDVVELSQVEAMDEVKLKEQLPPEYIPADEQTDEEFDEMIRMQNGVHDN